MSNLLRFHGFGDVQQLRPAAKGLEPRYYKGSQVTFIGRRVPQAVVGGRMV